MDRQCVLNPQSQIQNLSGLYYHYLYVAQTCSRCCAGCLAAAPIAEEKWATIDSIEKASKFMLKANFGESVLKIDISGGDPMLHPQLTEMFPILRKDHPLANIKVRCNGLGLEKMTDEKWEAYKKYQVAIDVRSYHLGNLQKWKDAGKQKGVACDAIEFGFEHPIMFNSIQYVEYPQVSGWQRFLWCSEPHRCVGIDCCLDRPRYYRCSLPMSWRHIEKKWPETKANSKLVKNADYFEIDDFLEDKVTLDDLTRIYSMPACKHCCRGENPGRYPADTVSKKIKEEYVLTQDVPSGMGYPEFVYHTTKCNQAPFSCSDHAHQQGFSCSEECTNKCPNYKKQPIFETKDELKAGLQDKDATIKQLQDMLNEQFRQRGWNARVGDGTYIQETGGVSAEWNTYDKERS